MPVQLWPSEYDTLRAEARSAMAAFFEQIDATRAPSGISLDQRIQHQRSAMRSLEVDHGGVDTLIADVPCRILRPQNAPSGIYLHFHGGGFTAGSARQGETANAHLRDTLGLSVISVDYRLAPEHPYPAAVDDGVAVLDWLIPQARSEFGTEAILIGGDSAGAYIAAATVLRLRDHGEDVRSLIRGMNLVYGGYDMRWCTPAALGCRSSGVPDVLTPSASSHIVNCFVPNLSEVERRAPSISPLFAELSNLPASLLTVGTADHLFDDNLLFAGRLAARGNHVELAVYPDCAHGFLYMPIELSRKAQARIDQFMAEQLEHSTESASARTE